MRPSVKRTPTRWVVVEASVIEPSTSPAMRPEAAASSSCSAVKMPSRWMRRADTASAASGTAPVNSKARVHRARSFKVGKA